MSPQPAAPAPAKPAETPAPVTPILAPLGLDKWVDETLNTGSDGAGVVERAKGLERIKGELLDLIGKNRDLLRLMAANGMLTEDQKAFVTLFYPDKEKGARRSKDDVEATRKAKEAARKGNTPNGAAA